MSEKLQFPWERDAARGMELPEGLGLADMMAYTAMRNIYERFREHRVDRDAAGREKRIVLHEWQKAKNREAFDRKMMDYHVKLVRTVEGAICACRKEPTVENAVRLCDAVDGMGDTGDLHLRGGD